jgi:methylated-DNA-[protein]-cysteine S-methyltransferase
MTTATRTKAAEISAESAYVFPSDLGWMAVTFADGRLTRLTFGHPSSAAAAAELPWNARCARDERELPDSIQKTVTRLQRFAAGEADSFADVELDLRHLTDFQRRVVKACRKIKAGQARSYAELATSAGSPRAARAVGNVMRSNRFPLIVPCHRVIGSDGKLCGFSSPQGLAMKEKLLGREGWQNQRIRRPR